MSSVLNKKGSEVIKYRCSRQEIEKILHLAKILSPREEAIVQLYHSVGLTQQRIGDAFGISQPRVHKILWNSYKKLSEVVIKSDIGRDVDFFLI